MKPLEASRLGLGKRAFVAGRVQERVLLLLNDPTKLLSEVLLHIAGI